MCLKKVGASSRAISKTIILNIELALSFFKHIFPCDFISYYLFFVEFTQNCSFKSAFYEIPSCTARLSQLHMFHVIISMSCENSLKTCNGSLDMFNITLKARRVSILSLWRLSSNTVNLLQFFLN